MTGRRGALIVAVAGTCIGFLSLTTLSLVTFDRLKYAVHASSDPVTAAWVWQHLGFVDVALAALVVLSGLAVAVAEWRGRGFSRTIGGQSPAGLLLVALPALLWFGHAILAPGLIVTGDAGTHVARVNHLAMAIADGSSLFWDNYFFGGSTLLQFTGPVFHWIAAILQLAIGDPTWAVKFTEFAARLAAAGFMYGYARRIGIGRPAAVITMLIYAGSYFVTYMEIVRSSFPQLINFAAMPAILYFAEGVLIAPSMVTPASAGLALSASVFVGCHQPTAAIFALFAAAYVICRLHMSGWPRPAIGGVLLSGVLAGAGSLYFLLPFALERSATADDFSAGSLLTFVWPRAETLRNVITWGRTGFGMEYSTYLGWPMLLLAASGLWAVTRGSRDRGLARLFVLCMVLALITLFVHGAYVRQLTMTFFFLCISASIGLQMLLSAWPRAWFLPALIFALVVVDSGPLAIQPWTREDVRFMERAGQYLAVTVPNQRILEITFDGDKMTATVDPTLTPLTEARVQILNGPHKQDATQAHNAFAATLKIAQDDLRGIAALKSSTATLLAALNVGLCVGLGDREMGLPASVMAGEPDGPLGLVLRIPNATPVLASSTLELMARPTSFSAAPFWELSFSDPRSVASDAKRDVTEIAKRMEIDLADRRAARFLVPRIPTGAEWAASNNAPPRISLTKYEVSPGKVHMVVEADRGGFIRLAHPLTPNTRITRGGVEITAIPDVESLIVLPVIPGTNDITLAWLPSLLRQVCFWISAGVWCLLLASLAIRRIKIA